MSIPLVALTGATGFIGRHLLKELPKRGYKIRVLLRRPTMLPPEASGAVVGDLAAPRNKTSPGCARNRPSPESLLAGRRALGSFRSTSPRHNLGSPASRVVRRLSVGAGDALSVTQQSTAGFLCNGSLA